MMRDLVHMRQRFEACVDRTSTPEGCHTWTALRDRHGYGSFGRHDRAPRVAWILAGRVIPDGMHVLHRCDNPPCVRLEHLWLGTHTDNMRDRDEKGRNVAHPGEANIFARLTEVEVREIRTLTFVPVVELARRYGVCADTIRRIRYRGGWRHVA